MDFGNRRRITNLAAGAAVGEPVTYEQLNSAIEAAAWKDSVRVSPAVNTNIAAPGATIDGITMVSGDRVLLRAQTAVPTNGIYIWNGAATPMTRALDASTFDELESAIVNVEEGVSSAGSTFRQTQVNGALETDNVIWASFGGSPSATETIAGIAELATQPETDAGTDNTRIVTPLKLATYSGRAKRYSTTIGDGSATSILVTHNLNTEDVQVYVREAGGFKRQVLAEVRHTSVNTVTILFDTAPAAASISVTILA